MRLLVLLAACGSSPPKREIVDYDDKCPRLPAQCLIGFDPFDDVDGCPEAALEIAFEPGSDDIPPSARPMLREIADDARDKLGRMVRIFVEAESRLDEPAGLDQRRVLNVITVLRGLDVPSTRLAFGDSRPPAAKPRVLIDCHEQ